MKRLTASVVLVAFLALTAWLFYQALAPVPLPLGSPFPAISTRSLGASAPTRLAPSGAGATVVMVYHTTCPACQETLRMLEDDLAELDRRDLEIVLLTSEADSVVRSFRLERAELAASPRVRWESAPAEELAAAFPLPGTPGLYVFGEGRLIRKVLGQHTLEGLLTGLEEPGVPVAPFPGGDG